MIAKVYMSASGRLVRMKSEGGRKQKMNEKSGEFRDPLSSRNRDRGRGSEEHCRFSRLGSWTYLQGFVPPVPLLTRDLRSARFVKPTCKRVRREGKLEKRAN